MTIPGVQKPHWRPWHSRKASWTGCRSPSAVSARPSIVVTVRPLACTASTLHDFTLVPSRWTVHAPQLEVSHPITVPVLPSFSQVLHQQHPRLDVVGDRGPVDGEFDL